MKKIRYLAVGAVCTLWAASASIAGPALASLPASRILTAGDSFDLTAAPTGAGPFQYQWQRNGVDLDGETNDTFTISSVTEQDAGNYSVRVSDELATSTSTPCALSVRDGSRLTLVYPGARSTYVAGLSGSNVVGFYDSLEQVDGWPERHGFLYNGSNWTQLRPPNAVRSEARGISSNRIVGSFTDTNNRRRGYLLVNGVYTVLDYPGSTETRAIGVEGDRIVGEYRDANSVRRGFLRTGSTWSNLSFPGSVATAARGISGNRIVGRYTDPFGGTNGFLLEGTNWTSLSYTQPIPGREDPGQTWSPTYHDATSVSGNTVAGEINNSNMGQGTSFLYQGGAWQILADSNRSAGIVYGIHGNRVAGFYLYQEPPNTTHPVFSGWLGFVDTLPAPEVTLPDTLFATNGAAFSKMVTANNAPASFAATNLPPGLTLNTSNGLMAGTPTWPGEYSATISASNASGTGSKDVTFFIENLQLRLPFQGSFSRQLAAPGGLAIFQGSDLPAGLSLSSSGLLSGTPTQTGYFTATIRASNPTGVFTSQIAFTVCRTNLVVTGRVVTPSNTPVANFPLRLVHPAFERRIFASATTDNNGSFTLSAPSDRNYQIVQANFTNVNTPPTQFLYPVHVFSDWFGTPVDAGNIPAVPVDRTILVRMVDAYSGEPVTGTNLSRMGAAALSCEFFPLADPVAIWMLHQIQIRAQKSFWNLAPEERAGLREEATRLVTATRWNPNGDNAQEAEINWSFLQGYATNELPPVYQADLGSNWNASTNVDFYQETPSFEYLAKTNSSGLYEVPVAVMGNDPRVNPWYTQSGWPDAQPEPACALQFRINAPEGVRGKVIALQKIVYERGFGRPGYLSNNPLAFDLQVRPAPRTITGNFYRSNGTTPVTNGSVHLEQWSEYPGRNVFIQSSVVDSAGRFQFAASEDARDDWRITGEERSDTQTNAAGWNYFTCARQYLFVSSNDITGVRLIADQAPGITSIQGGLAGETFRVNGSNLACLGEVSLRPAAGSGDEVVIQPIITELWTRNRGAGSVEFGLPDYLSPGQYQIQYRYPTVAGNLQRDNFGNFPVFITVNDTNSFVVGPGTNPLSFGGFPGGLVRLPIRYADKNLWSLTLSNNSTNPPLMLQPRNITSQYVETLLPEDAGLGEWSLQWGSDNLPLAGVTLDDPAPVISLDPVDQAVAGGGTANFAVGAAGAQPLRYQWTLNGLNVDGATNPSLQITNARAIHQGDYVAVVSNWAGFVTSAVARLSVQQAPQILTQPKGTNLMAGQTHTLAVLAEGSEPLVYQWRRGGTNLEGATSSTLALNSVSASDAGTYSVRITNGVGSVVSSNAVVGVFSPPQFAVQATHGLRGNLGVALRYDPVVTGSPATFTSSNLPAGLTVNRSNGVITGTPANAAYTRFSVTASNAAGTDTLPLALTVPAAPSTLPFLDEFSAAPPATRYLKLNLGMPASLVWTNQSLRYVSAAGDGDSAIAGWSPSLPLSLTNSWEVTLDAQMPDGWETPSAAAGISLFPDSPTMTLEQFNPHRLHFRLDRDTTADIPGNRFYRCSYASDEEFPAVPLETNPTTQTRGKLRFLYTTNSRTLHTLYQAGTNPAWVALGDPVDFDPASPGSLAEAWGLAATNRLRLILWGDSAATNGSAGQSITLDNLAVRAGSAPGITHPPIATNVVVGGAATLAVMPSGQDPFFYQWRLNGTNLTGATNASLRLENVQAVDGGLYSAVVSNLFGSVTSSNARLAVIQPPVFPPQATNGLRGNLGQAFSFVPVLSNGPATFTSSNLPAGLTVNRSNGVITGTPTIAAYTRFSVTASNAAGTDTLSLGLTVPAAPSALPLVDGFTSSTPNRYMVADISELLGDPEYFPQAGRLSLAVTNGVLRLICPTNSLGFHSLAWVPGVSLPLSSPWEILLDVQVPNNYLTQESQLGFTVFPALPPADNAESEVGHDPRIERLFSTGSELNFYLNRDTEFTGSPETENLLERTAYIINQEQPYGAVLLTNATNATLRIAYRADQKTLSTWGRANPGGEWVKVGGDVDFNPANSNSLARRWDLATNASLQLAITAYFEITHASALPQIFADNLIARAGVGPAIATQPRATNVAVGGAATFAATASGPDPFFYQWRLNGTNVAQGTNATLQVTNVQPSLAGNYSVLVSNLFGSVTSSNARLTVIQPPVFPPQATNGLRGNLGQAFSFVPVLSNGPAIFTVAGLTNSGLTVNRTNGTISGTPTSSGYYRATLTASNAAGIATLPVSITVPGTRLTGTLADNFSTVTPNRYLPFNFYSPGSMRITNGAARFVSPADGTNGSTAGLALNLPLALTNSWDVSADVTLPNGWVTPEAEIGISLDTMFGTNDTVESILSRGQEISLVLNRDTEIEGSNNARRSVYVGGEDQESLRTTLTNDAVTSARLRFVYQTNGRSLRAWVQTNSTAPWVAVGDALDMNPSTVGSLAQRWGLSNGSSLFLTLTAYAQGGTGTNHLSLDNLSVGAPVPPVITSTGNLTGQVGQPLVFTNRATNGPAEFASTNLPDGLSLNPISGVISGAPTTAGLTNLVVTARTPAGTAVRTNVVVILPAFTGTNAVAGTVNDGNFRHEVLVGPHNFGTNLRFSASNLPIGTTINATNGMITGRPANAGTFPSTVTITALGVTARQNIQFTFPAGQGAGLTLNLNPRPSSVTNLPAGLSYNASTGVISGVPATWGAFTAVGRFANNTTTNIPIDILPSAPVITSPTNWVVQAGVEAQYQIVAGGVGREWAGYDDFSTNTSKWTLSGIRGTTLLTSSGALANRTTGSNSSQDGLAYWQRLLPRTANWEVWMKAYLPTNAPVVGQDFKLGLLLGNQVRNNGQVWEVRHLFADGRYVAQHKRLTTLTDTNKLVVVLGTQPREVYDLVLKYTATNQLLRGFVFNAEGNEITNQIVSLPAGFGTFLTPGIVSECNGKPLQPTNTFSADDFLILPDPGAIEYRAYLVDANDTALLDESNQPYLPSGLVCDPDSGTVEGILAEDFPGGTYRMKVEAVYRPERLPGNSPPVLVGSAIVALRVIPAGRVTMEFVPVGDPGNPAFHASGRGRVNANYFMGKYKVTVGQYATFLNAVAKSEFEIEPSKYILYDLDMAMQANAGGILRLGTNGAYRYQILGSPDRPATFVSWQAAARFCNWMENGQGTNSILTGTYDFSTNPSGWPSGSIVKNPAANFRIPNGNEWFKAAYYDPTKTGTNKYWRYATRSDVRPGNSSLLGANQANTRLGGLYFLSRSGTLDPSQNYLTDVGAFRNSASYYGTFDQNGNLNEWIDELAFNQNDSRMRWGGAWTDSSDERMKSSDYLPASDNSIGSHGQGEHIGFRILCTTPP